MGDTAETNTANMTTVITALNDLDKITSDVFPETFHANLVLIMPYDKQVIMSKLDKRDKNTLKVLRTQLLTEIPRQFEDFAGKTAIDRTSINLICQDIVTLGRSLANRKKSTELPNIYRKEINQPDMLVDPTNVTDLAGVINIVVNLNLDMKSLRAEIANQNSKIATQDTEIAKHKEVIAKQKTEISVIKASMSSQAANIESDETEPQLSNASEVPNQIANEGPMQQATAYGPQEATMSNLITQVVLRNTESSLPSNYESEVENSQPQVVQRRKRARNQKSTLIVEPNVTDLFIGNVQSENNIANIQSHIIAKTDTKIELTDIHEIKLSGNKKAFRVTVPQDKAQDILAKWPSPIKVELYAFPKPKVSTLKQSNSQNRNNGNKRNNRRSTFHGQAPNTHRRRPYAQYPNHQDYNAWARPSYPSQHWEQHQSPEWYYQPYYN